MNKVKPTYDVPHGEAARQREAHAAAVTPSRPKRRRAEAVSLRDLRNLSIFSVVVAGYVWGHVAGAIELFGRP